MLADYKNGVTNGEVIAKKQKESYAVFIDGKVLRSMSSGGAQIFRTKLQAEVYGRQYVRGYVSGSYLSGEPIE